jgi:aminoglycoside 2''-phosphotransferase
MMDKRKAYLQTLSECYPDLPIGSAHLLKDGQYNDVLVVNDALIFRFPRYAEGVPTIQNEVRILSRIQGYTTLPVPNPVYTSKKGEQKLGQVFMGYRMLPGRPLWRHRLQGIDDDGVLQRLAAQLARFLKELHSIPVADVGEELPVEDSLEEATQLYAQIRSHLFRFMRPDARDRVANHFEAYLNSPHLHTYPLALKHGDFGGSNILYDQGSQTISGIIDFGFAGLGDPALDIAAVSTYGESFLNRFHNTYPEIESMWERAAFYRGTYALVEALHGFKNDDEEAFAAGMAAYV